MLADRLVVLTAFLVVLLAASLVSAIPIYANAVAQSSLRERLQRAPTTDANLQATVDVEPGGHRRLDRRVERIARDAFGVTDATIHRSAESEPFAARGRIVVFGFFDGLTHHARLVAGRWPDSRDAPVEVVVPASVASELRLRIGELVSARSRLDDDTVVAARIVGVYHVEHPLSAYWWGRPLAEGGAGPLVTTRSSFFELELQYAELRWRLEPDFRRLTIGQATRLRQELTSLPRRLNAGRPSGQQFTIETNLPEILADTKQALHRARAGVLVPSIQLGLLAAYGLLVAAVLLTERRLFRTESMRLRGATAAQLMTIALVEASLIALPAIALAPWAAVGVLHALNAIGPLAAIDMELEPHVSSIAYLLAVGAGAVCVAGLALAALLASRVGVADRRRRGPLAGLTQRVRIDLALAVLALLGYWQLRRYHGVLVSNQAGLGIDPFLVVAPALLLLAGALLSLRLIPLASKLVERVVASSRGAVVALGFWQLARRPRGYARSVLLLVLAVAIGVFSAAYSRTWHQSQIDQAEYSAGADLLVEPSEASGSPPSIGLASAYRTLGVDHLLPVATESFSLDRFGGESANVLALDVTRAGAVHVRSDFASRSLSELLRRVSADRGSLASLSLPGRPTRLALSLQLASVPERRSPVLPGSEVRRSSPSVFLYLRDGDGVLYSYRLGGPALGRDSRFELDLSHRLPSGRPAPPRYPLALVGLELVDQVPELVANRVTLDVRSLEVASGARGKWIRVPLATQARWRASLSNFSFVYERPRVAGVSATNGSVRARVVTGSSYSWRGERPPSIAVLLRPGRDLLPRAAPALASESFLEATSARVGHVVPLALSTGTQAVRIVGSYRRFPTLDPALPSVLVDLSTYAALSLARHGVLVQPSQWWLEAGDDPDVAAQLRASPYRSVSVVSRSERERELLEDPAPLGVIGALTLGFVVAAAFAAVGYAAGATASARSRMLEFAVLRTLGLRAGQLSGLIGLESALVVVLSLLAGTVLGLVVAWLVLPYVALGATGEASVPPVQLTVPWATVLWLDLAVLGALAALAAAQVGYLRRLQPAPVLRGGDGVVAP